MDDDKIYISDDAVANAMADADEFIISDRTTSMDDYQDSSDFVTITINDQLSMFDDYSDTEWGSITMTNQSKIKIDDDFVMTGEEFKTCLKLIMKQLKKSNPEEFI